jgi:hypothetical protein
MHEVLEILIRQVRQTRQIKQQVAVTIEQDHPSLRQRDGYAQSHCGAQTKIYLQEIGIAGS